MPDDVISTSEIKVATEGLDGLIGDVGAKPESTVEAIALVLINRGDLDPVEHMQILALTLAVAIKRLAAHA
jgi:hypothetical protein